jgi:hypothetical protein
MKRKSIRISFSNNCLVKPKLQIIILMICLLSNHLFCMSIINDLCRLNYFNENKVIIKKKIFSQLKVRGTRDINKSILHNEKSALIRSKNDGSLPRYSLQLIEGSDAPLIDQTNPGSSGISHGLECGQVFFYKKNYHLFITEKVISADFGVDLTRFGHWKSSDGISWTRISTLKNSIKIPKNPRHAIWSPMPIYDKSNERWNIFYVGYEEGANNPHGRIFRAYSKAKGLNGLDGPYIDETDTDTVLSYYDTNKNSWEGRQGADSFYPFQVGNNWYAFYGSSDAASYWDVGLVTASSLDGPWKRDGKPNPVFTYCENPIVITLDKGVKFCVYDDLAHGISDCHSIGYGYSTDGVNWVQKYLSIPLPKWATCIRTPLSFIYEGNDIYIIYFTALTPGDYNGFEKVGRIKVKLVKD